MTISSLASITSPCAGSRGLGQQLLRILCALSVITLSLHFQMSAEGTSLIQSVNTQNWGCSSSDSVSYFCKTDSCH